MQLTLGLVKVSKFEGQLVAQMCFLTMTLNEIENIWALQLKDHGHPGILGALVLVYVIVTQNGIEQESSQGEICLALAMKLRKQAALLRCSPNRACR